MLAPLSRVFGSLLTSHRRNSDWYAMKRVPLRLPQTKTTSRFYRVRFHSVSDGTSACTSSTSASTELIRYRKELSLPGWQLAKSTVTPSGSESSAAAMHGDGDGALVTHPLIFGPFYNIQTTKQEVSTATSLILLPIDKYLHDKHGEPQRIAAGIMYFGPGMIYPMKSLQRDYAIYIG